MSHYKSGDVGTDDNGDRRQAEAVAIRADEATLPATARVFYVGDYNLNSASDPGYETITPPGQGQAIDPINSPYFLRQSGAARDQNRECHSARTAGSIWNS